MATIPDHLIDDGRDDLFLQTWLPQVLTPSEYLETRTLSIELIRALHSDVYLGGPHYPAFLVTFPRLIEMIETAFKDHTHQVIRELYTLSQEFEELHYSEDGYPARIDAIDSRYDYTEINVGCSDIIPHTNIWGNVLQPNTPPWPSTRAGDVRPYARAWKLDEQDFTEVIRNYFVAYATQDVYKVSPETQPFYTAFQSFIARWELDA